VPGPLLVGAEEVILVQDMENYGSSRPVNEGLELVMALSHFPTSQVIMMCNTADTPTAEFFCKIHGLKGVEVVGLQPEDRHEPLPSVQWRAVKRQRALGPVNLVITAYREVYERCGGAHQPCILFGRRGGLISHDERTTWAEASEAVRRRRYAEVDEDQ
jgi:hypothetical protein